MSDDLIILRTCRSMSMTEATYFNEALEKAAKRCKKTLLVLPNGVDVAYPSSIPAVDAAKEICELADKVHNDLFVKGQPLVQDGRPVDHTDLNRLGDLARAWLKQYAGGQK